MFVNAFEFEVTTTNDELIPVSLRLGAGGQLKLKKKYNESTTDTLFGAVDDIERFVDVMQNSLCYSGNTNKITSAERLIDLMAENDMLGMAARQKVITALGRASGIFSENEKAAIDKQADKMIDGLFEEKPAAEKKEKNE